MLSRRQFQVRVMGGAVLLAAPALQVQASVEKPRIKLAVFTRDSFNQLPLTVAHEQGYFKSEGLDVELLDGSLPTGAAPDVISSAYTRVLGAHAQRALAASAQPAASGAVVSGATPNASASPITPAPPNTPPAPQNLPQSFAQLGRGPLVALGLSAASLQADGLPADPALRLLRGKRVGVVRNGVLTSVLARYVLSRAGLSAQDVSLVALDSPGAAISALRNGHIEAMSNCDPVMSLLEMRGEIKVLSDARTLRGAQLVFGGPMPAVCLHAPQGFVAANPRTCQALANGLVRALKWLRAAGPSDMVKTVPESDMMGDRALYLASFARARESFSTDALLSDELARTALKVLAQYDSTLKTARLDLSATYTNEFAVRAKAKLRA